MERFQLQGSCRLDSHRECEKPFHMSVIERFTFERLLGAEDKTYGFPDGGMDGSPIVPATISPWGNFPLRERRRAGISPRNRTVSSIESVPCPRHAACNVNRRHACVCEVGGLRARGARLLARARAAFRGVGGHLPEPRTERFQLKQQVLHALHRRLLLDGVSRRKQHRRL